MLFDFEKFTSDCSQVLYQEMKSNWIMQSFPIDSFRTNLSIENRYDSSKRYTETVETSELVDPTSEYIVFLALYNASQCK